MKIADVETIHVPRQFTDLARRRTRNLMLASVHFPDALEVMLHSAYLQGLEDGYQTAERVRPEPDGREPR